VFENLLFQNHVVETLKREIEGGNLPQSMLFFGEPYSGKLTAALELARVVNCEFTGEWGCSCKSCTQSLSLQHPYTLLTGSRYSMLEINQSADFLINERSRSSQFVFTRNVRKLIKRFNEDLWDKEDNKYKKAVSSLNNIEEILYLIEPTQNLPAEKKLQSTVKKILTECGKLANELPKGNIPISQIRKISNWVRRSSSGNKKVVILERAELMQDSSRNALLKVLEEPPRDTYFILISEKRSTVLPTILSRVRTYSFKHRDNKEQELILNKLFKTSSDKNSIKEYFLSYSDYEGDAFLKIVQNYTEFCFNKNGAFSDALDSKIDVSYFNEFLEVFTNELKRVYYNNDGVISLNQLEAINSSIRDKVIKLLHYNQNPMLLLETLYYEVKRIIYA